MKTRTAAGDDKLKKAVSRSVLFNQLSAEKLDELISQARVIGLNEGEFLFQHGDEAKAFFLLLSGELKLAAGSHSGQEKILHILQPGQTFAEALMFQDAPRYPVNVVALAPSKVISFPSEKYKSILSGSIEACFGVMSSYSMRIRQLVDEIEVLTLHNATFRVIHYLLKEIPSHQHEAISVKLSAPKNVIASRLAITPETLSRILAKLKREGAIKVSDKQIELLDIDWMRKFIATS